MIRCILFALGVLLLLTPADAQPRHHDLLPMRIVIETIDHSKQRYPTVGDWQARTDGLHITVSKMSDPRYEFLVGMHEAIEAVLCQHAGISPAAVDRFDKAYEARRKKGRSVRARRRSPRALPSPASGCDQHREAAGETARCRLGSL
jgi:hypothetical protein